ncbi:hypothetical protein H4R34_000283 [Dimargaris verticillata]|uniref:SET domain-containing protein n=1 Tax=Dimargaris verticillata TaxID=2761393 RepID=A0A9W8BDL4_9FUNG|nr:hypothetical protein H4R34_000283 [Dimargaris verticillata]
MASSVARALAPFDLEWSEPSLAQRGVRATRAFQPGDVVLRSQALTYYETCDSSQAARTCHYCLTREAALVSCPHCQTEWYCSLACRAQAWVNDHGRICALQSQRAALGVGSAAQVGVAAYLAKAHLLQMLLHVLDQLQAIWDRLATRLPPRVGNIAQALGDLHRALTKPEESLLIFLQLLSNYAEFNVTAQQSMHQTVSTALAQGNWPFLRDDRFQQLAAWARRDPETEQFFAAKFTRQFLLDCLGRFQCNSFQVYDEQLFAVGDGTYPLAALVNHSCQPNCVALYRPGGVMELLALEPLEPGTEVTIAYIDTITPKHERQATLKGRYQFQCQCRRCIAEPKFASLGSRDPMPSTLPSAVWGIVDTILATPCSPRALQHFRDLLRCHESLSVHIATMATLHPQFAQLFQRSRKLLSLFANDANSQDAGVSEYTQTRVSYIIAIGQAARGTLEFPGYCLDYVKAVTLDQSTAIEAQAWLWASMAGLGALVGYFLVYPQYHPLLTLHCFTVAKLLWNSDPDHRDLQLASSLVNLALQGLRRTHPPTSSVVCDCQHLAKLLQQARR